MGVIEVKNVVGLKVPALDEVETPSIINSSGHMNNGASRGRIVVSLRWLHHSETPLFTYPTSPLCGLYIRSHHMACPGTGLRAGIDAGGEDDKGT